MPLPAEVFSREAAADKESIIEQLKEWIVTLQLEPGEKISDMEIAAYFHTGRTPIREVLKRLAQQKLICTVPGRATTIAPIALNHVEELYAPMCALQCLAAKNAAERASEEDIVRLIEANEDFYVRMLQRGDDAYPVLQGDRCFHDIVVRMSGNEYIGALCESLWTHIARMDYLYFRDAEILRGSYDEHMELIHALRLRDPYGAEIAMKKNWENSMLGLQGLISEESVRGGLVKQNRSIRKRSGS